jgi:hypothetical protein
MLDPKKLEKAYKPFSRRVLFGESEKSSLSPSILFIIRISSDSIVPISSHKSAFIY